jgi:drug/metabolite transporter (DMT)-like permease
MASQNTAPHFLKGMTLVLLAVLLFACIDTVAKYLLTKFNVPLVAGVRYGLNLVFLVALMAPRHGSNLWKTQRTGLVVVRGLSLAAATFFASLALQRMPVGETVAILYLQGFAVMLAAGYFLGERVGLPGWFAAVMGFTGVLLIARPSGALAPLGVVFALLGAAVSVIYVLLSRSLAKTESTMAMLLHVAVAGSVVFGVMLVFNWQSFAFTWTDVALLVFMGAASLAAHFLFTSAYRFAPASMLAPFSYAHIAITTVLSWLVYAHVPDGFALIGMAMIGVSGAAIAVHSHMSRGAVAG